MVEGSVFRRQQLRLCEGKAARTDANENEREEGREERGRKEREGKTTTNKDAFVRVAEIFVATFPVF